MLESKKLIELKIPRQPLAIEKSLISTAMYLRAQLRLTIPQYMSNFDFFLPQQKKNAMNTKFS